MKEQSAETMPGLPKEKAEAWGQGGDLEPLHARLQGQKDKTWSHHGRKWTWAPYTAVSACVGLE